MEPAVPSPGRSRRAVEPSSGGDPFLDEPLEPITRWYSALKQQAGINDDEAIRRARETYRLATTPLQRAPRDLIQWSESWEHAILDTQRKGVFEALNTKCWVSDFLNTVKPILSHWVTSYKLLKATQLTLSYQEVAGDFREEVRQAPKAKRQLLVAHPPKLKNLRLYKHFLSYLHKSNTIK